MANGAEIQCLIGGNIARARKQGGWTQKAFARLVGVSAQFFCQVEMGRKQCPNDLMDRITSALRIKPVDLLSTYELPAEPVDPDSIEIPLMFDDDEKHERSAEMLHRFWALDRRQQNVLMQIADEMAKDDLTDDMKRIASFQREYEKVAATMILMAKKNRA